MFLQQELTIDHDVVMKLYYEEVLDLALPSPSRMQELMEKAMDQVRKENYSDFLKCLPICDPIFGKEFLEQVQMHYDMCSESKMLTEKMQMLVTSYVSNEQKVKWFKQWNQSTVAKEEQSKEWWGKNYG